MAVAVAVAEPLQPQRGEPRNDMLPGEPAPLRPGKAPFQLIRSQVLHVAEQLFPVDGDFRTVVRHTVLDGAAGRQHHDAVVTIGRVRIEGHVRDHEQVRKLRLQGADGLLQEPVGVEALLSPRVLEFVRQARKQGNAAHTELPGLTGLDPYLIGWEVIAVRVVQGACKTAEAAPSVAVVGVGDVSIDHVGHVVPASLSPHLVGLEEDCHQIGSLGSQKAHHTLVVEALALMSLVEEANDFVIKAGDFLPLIVLPGHIEAELFYRDVVSW
jgi:hypothetical protein